MQVPAAIEQRAIVTRRLSPDAFEQRRIAQHISGRRDPAVAHLGIEMAKEDIAPRGIHRLESRRTMTKEGGPVAAFGREIMDERDAILGEGVDMRQALRDRQFAGRGRHDRKARIDDA